MKAIPASGSIRPACPTPCCPAKAHTRTTPPALVAEPSATAPRPGATCRRISACGPPTARRPGVLWKTGPSPTTTWNRFTTRRNTRSASPAITPARRFTARAGAICPCRRFRPIANSSILEPAAQAPGPASVSSPHGAQQRALQRPRPLHALPLVLRIRLRSRRQKRLAEYRASPSPSPPETANCAPSAW